MLHALIDANDIIANLIVGPNASYTPPDGLTLAAVPLDAAIGDTWTNDTLTKVPKVLPAPTRDDVNAERDRRIADSFVFGGVAYDNNEQSKARITGAATLAGFAIVNGAQPGDLRWHGGATDFSWITADNSIVTMDAQTCFAFGQAAASHEKDHVFAAKALKVLGPIPADYATNEAYWP